MLKKYICFGCLLTIVAFFVSLTPTPVSAACNPLASDKGQAKYTISVPETTTYTLWLRMLANGKSDGVEVQVDNTCPVLQGTLQPPQNGFAWVTL